MHEHRSTLSRNHASALPRHRMIRVLAGLVVATLAGALGVVTAGPAGANGPPSAPPYSKIAVGDDFGGVELSCDDSDGTTIYQGYAWTLEPLVRGPIFAPVTLWLSGAGNAPVVPLSFSADGFPLQWHVGSIANPVMGSASAQGRPVAYGPMPTDTAPRVTCEATQQGYVDFGTYVITSGLAATIGLYDADDNPVDTTQFIGQTLAFDNEASFSFSVPRTQFPLTATAKATTWTTADQAKYYRTPLGGSTTTSRVTCKAASQQLYQGSAFTFSPLVRGYQWAPMALWLTNDRIVTPRWFTSTVKGTWATASGSPALHGSVNKTTSAAPSGYGTKPDTTRDNTCSWAAAQSNTLTVTKAIATQLGLPASTIGRSVKLTTTSSVTSYISRWLFPPAT